MGNDWGARDTGFGLGSGGRTGGTGGGFSGGTGGGQDETRRLRAVDIMTEKPHMGDTYLLCADGLTGMVKDDQMLHILMVERDLDRAVDRLVAAANEEGGIDNISVVLARVEAA